MDPKVPLLEHWLELRRRLLTVFFVVILFSSLSYFFAEDILAFLAKPYGRRLILLAPHESFLLVLKTSVFAGFLLALPVTIYQAWAFIAEAVPGYLKLSIFILFFPSLVLAVLGLLVAYFFVIPYGLRFLLSFGSAVFEPILNASSYYSFIFLLLTLFALIFQLPIFIICLVKSNIITKEQLTKHRRHAILFMFVIAAILTPPDAFTQIALAIPLVLLYEISILVCKIL